jgi:hypothetical protein
MRDQVDHDHQRVAKARRQQRSSHEAVRLKAGRNQHPGEEQIDRRAREDAQQVPGPWYPRPQLAAAHASCAAQR